MSWDLEFVGSLNSSSLYVKYRLEFIGVLNALGEPFSVSEDQGIIQIARGSIRITGSRVIPQRWSVSFGGFSLQLTGDIRSILPKMRKGQLAVLQCSINRSGYRNLAIGSLDTISGQRGLFSLGFKDLLSALQTSLDTRAGTVFSTTDPPHFSLFYEVGRTTTSTGSDLGTGDTTLNLTDASFFKKAGSKGIAKCINDGVGGGNEEFYVFWDNSTSTTLTISGTANYNNTTRVPLKSGSTVKYCAWLQGEPYEIIASILTSTGTGNNGEFDVYPVEWGIGGKIDKQIFDLSDAKRASKEITRSTGGDYDIGFAVESPLTNGFRSIVDIFLAVGIFPVYRQDSISIRACTDPEGKETRKTPDIRAQISDYDIITVLSHDFFSPDISNIYRTTYIKYNFVNVYYSGGVYNGSRVDSLPAVSEISRGKVIFTQNPLLCYIDTINWQAITKDKVYFKEMAKKEHCKYKNIHIFINMILMITLFKGGGGGLCKALVILCVFSNQTKLMLISLLVIYQSQHAGALSFSRRMSVYLCLSFRLSVCLSVCLHLISRCIPPSLFPAV